MRILTVLIAVFYFTAFVYVVFLLPRRQNFKTNEVRGFLNLIPIIKMQKDIKRLETAQPSATTDYLVNLFGNIILFIPYSLIFFLGFNWTTSRILLVAILLSISTEVIQFIFGLGVADIDDVLLNMTGTFLGLYIARIFTQKTKMKTGKQPS